MLWNCHHGTPCTILRYDRIKTACLIASYFDTKVANVFMEQDAFPWRDRSLPTCYILLGTFCSANQSKMCLDVISELCQVRLTGSRSPLLPGSRSCQRARRSAPRTRCVHIAPDQGLPRAVHSCRWMHDTRSQRKADHGIDQFLPEWSSPNTKIVFDF